MPPYVHTRLVHQKGAAVKQLFAALGIVSSILPVPIRAIAQEETFIVGEFGTGVTVTGFGEQVSVDDTYRLSGFGAVGVLIRESAESAEVTSSARIELREDSTTGVDSRADRVSILLDDRSEILTRRNGDQELTNPGFTIGLRAEGAELEIEHRGVMRSLGAPEGDFGMMAGITVLDRTDESSAFFGNRSTILNGPLGLIGADEAVQLRGIATELTNAGVLSGQATGVAVLPDPDADFGTTHRIVNTGQIVGGRPGAAAIRVTGRDEDFVSISNSAFGVIEAVVGGIAIDASLGQAAVGIGLNDASLVRGDVRLSTNADRLILSGDAQLVGNVDMGGSTGRDVQRVSLGGNGLLRGNLGFGDGVTSELFMTGTSRISGRVEGGAGTELVSLRDEAAIGGPVSLGGNEDFVDVDPNVPFHLTGSFFDGGGQDLSGGGDGFRLGLSAPRAALLDAAGTPRFDPDAEPDRIDGSRIRNFERVEIRRERSVDLFDTLVVPGRTIIDSPVFLDNARIETRVFILGEQGVVSGNGEIHAAEGSLVEGRLTAGGSPGRLVFNGPTTLMDGSRLEIEIFGTQDGLFDSYIFGGPLQVADGSMLEFVFDNRVPGLLPDFLRDVGVEDIFGTAPGTRSVLQGMRFATNLTASDGTAITLTAQADGFTANVPTPVPVLPALAPYGSVVALLAWLLGPVRGAPRHGAGGRPSGSAESAGVTR